MDVCMYVCLYIYIYIYLPRGAASHEWLGWHPTKKEKGNLFIDM